MTTTQSQIAKAALIVFYIAVTIICLLAGFYTYPVSKIASAAFILVAYGLYGIARVIDESWSEWFNQKETS